jgi:hypothetical protein
LSGSYCFHAWWKYENKQDHKERAVLNECNPPLNPAPQDHRLEAKQDPKQKQDRAQGTARTEAVINWYTFVSFVALHARLFHYVRIIAFNETRVKNACLINLRILTSLREKDFLNFLVYTYTLSKYVLCVRD